MKTLENWAQRALVLLALCFVVGLYSCEQEVIEPEFLGSEINTVELETGGNDDDPPPPPCTNCDDDD